MVPAAEVGAATMVVVAAVTVVAAAKVVEAATVVAAVARATTQRPVGAPSRCLESTVTRLGKPRHRSLFAQINPVGVTVKAEVEADLG